MLRHWARPILSKMYESDELVQAEIIEIKKVYDGSDDEINNLYKTGRQVSLDYFEKMYEL